MEYRLSAFRLRGCGVLPALSRNGWCRSPEVTAQWLEYLTWPAAGEPRESLLTRTGYFKDFYVKSMLGLLGPFSYGFCTFEINPASVGVGVSFWKDFLCRGRLEGR